VLPAKGSDEAPAPATVFTQIGHLIFRRCLKRYAAVSCMQAHARLQDLFGMPGAYGVHASFLLPLTSKLQREIS
jgi:hypothetical protein